MNEWIARPATSRDTEEIVTLMKAGMGEGIIPRTKEFWEWKHLKNPFGISPALVAEFSGRIIGLRVFMRWNWTCGDETVPAVRAVDTTTHPDWRGKHIFQKLTLQLKEEMKQNGFRFVFNTPNQSSLPGYLKMGWEKVGRISLWVRPLKLLRPAYGLLFGPAVKPLELENHRYAGEFFSQPEAADFLNRCLYSDRRYHTHRSAQYLKWRYVDIPGFQYHAKWHWDQDAGAVLIFRNRTRRRLHELSLSEILHTPGRPGLELASRLLRELARESRADYIVATAASHSSEASVLNDSRFVRLGRVGPTLAVHSLNKDPELPDPMLGSSWCCTIGDLEIF